MLEAGYIIDFESESMVYARTAMALQLVC